MLSELAQYAPGDVVQVGVMHCDGTQATVPITLGVGSPTGG
ncbi:MAG: hypothetical protein ACLP8S_11385 [Solirubrobacteraceae bacterium]